MNRILKYLKGRKGITLVWMAFMLAVLLMLAGMAIDIAYMYYVKNQLQVAADASALAGAGELTGTGTTQEKARRAAWKFACKNKAAGANIYLIDNFGQPTDIFNEQNCNIADTLSANQLTGGDIFVGKWDGGDCVGLGSESETPDCVKADARRTTGSPGGSVRVFIGQIFRIINADWSFMSARANAIAALFPAKVLPIVANEYWLQLDTSSRPYPDDVHEYPSSFVRKNNVDGTSSKAWGKTFAILGSNADDNVPANFVDPVTGEKIKVPGSQNVNGYVNMDYRSSNHDGSGTSWYQVNTSATSVNCSNCPNGFFPAATYNSGAIQNDKMDDESLQYLHEGYNYILPTAVKEEYRANYALPNYLIPTSNCPFATIAYFSSSGIVPINAKYNGKDFAEVFPKGTKIVTMVYDGTFTYKDANTPNAVTNVGYILLQIDGYASPNPKGLDFNNLGNSGNTVYAHALTDIVQPASPFGTCDEDFLRSIRDLQIEGGTIKLVQ